VAESNLTVFKDANVPREATLGVVWGHPPSLSDTVSEIDTDHGVDVMWNDALRVDPSRVRFVT
jgi:hypothetical protein